MNFVEALLVLELRDDINQGRLYNLMTAHRLLNVFEK